MFWRDDFCCLCLRRCGCFSIDRKQRKFDQLLAEEKGKADKLAAEKDQAEQSTREKETRIMSLQRDVDELRDSIQESERVRKQQQNELESVINNKDAAGKSVVELDRANRLLEQQLEEQKVLITELEDENSELENTKLRLEVNQQAARSQFDRELQAKEEQAEDKRKGLMKQVKRE